MPPWQPENDFEAQLFAAVDSGETVTALALLRGAELALPITPAAAAGDEPPAWATAQGPDRTWLVAYTSVAAMTTGTSGAMTHCRVASLPEIAAGWPDQRWGLAVDPGLPCALFLESGTVARLAAPPLATEYAERSDPPVVQKLLGEGDVAAVLGAAPCRVSGYVHLLDEVAHIATPAVLVTALGFRADEPGRLDEAGSVSLLRWPAVGLDLYRSPYGGEDDVAREAVAGWVVEEPPFRGLGFGRDVDEVIREFKLDAVLLPHGAEIWELDIDGVEHRRAVYDGDRDVWLLGVPVSVVPEDE